MPENQPARETADEQAAQIREWSSMAKAADDSLAALETGNMKQVHEHLKVIQDVATQKAKHTRRWRKMVWLAEDALRAIAAGNKNRAREYLVAIRAVAQCAQEA